MLVSCPETDGRGECEGDEVVSEEEAAATAAWVGGGWLVDGDGLLSVPTTLIGSGFWDADGKSFHWPVALVYLGLLGLTVSVVVM